MKKFITLLLMHLSIATILGKDFSYNNIAYNVIDDVNKTVEVTSGSDIRVSYITIPETVYFNNVAYTVVGIGDISFYLNKGLISITLPKTITYIGGMAFDKCTSLSKINLEDTSISKIGSSAFYYCIRLERIDLPKTVTYIGGSAFKDCTSLSKINLEDTSIKLIYEEAFKGCESLRNVILPDSLERIGFGAFGGCKLLTSSLAIPESVTTIGEDAFGGCDNIKTLYFNARACNNISSACKLYPPFPSVRYLYFGDHVQNLSKNFFTMFNELEEINILNIEAWLRLQISDKDGNPIYHTKSLKIDGEEPRRHITIPDGVQRINSFAFAGFRQLLSVTMPTSLKSIGNEAFVDCVNLHKCIYPSLEDYLSINYDSPNALSNYGNDSYTIIGNDVFDKSKLTNYSWPSKFSRIPDYAFYDYTNLSSIDIPESVTEIGKYAFCYVNLSSINIPTSVVSIGEMAFWNALTKDAKLEINNVNTWARIKFGDPYANPIRWLRKFYVNGKIPIHLDIDLENNTIGPYAFCYANNLNTVRVIASEISNNSFANCSNIESVCLEVSEIDENAFSNTVPKTVYSMTSTPPEAPNTAFHEYLYSKLYVPYGSKNEYEAAETCWWKFFDIEESDFSNIDDIFKADYNNSDAGIRNVTTNDEYDLHINVIGNRISVSDNGNAPVIIYDTLGECIYSGTGCKQVELASGVYIIRINNMTKKVCIH